MAQVLSAFIFSPTVIFMGALSLTRFSTFYFFLFLLSVSVLLFHLELFLELTYTKCMANNLRCPAAEESEDTLNAFTSPTGYEPKLLAFDELYDSSVPFSLMIPSSDQDMDDLTFGEMLTAAHRGQVDLLRTRRHVSQVSRRLLCSMDQGNLMEREMSINQLILVSRETRIVLTASFSENTQTEKMVDGSGKPEERNSSN